jgi:large subunit ribosomal protein L22
MEMARTGYSLKIQGDDVARAKANELPISPKHAIEIGNFIKKMTTNEAIAYLEEVTALKKPIPFKRFNRNVAHKRGLDKWDAGRFPVKASKSYIRLLKSAEKNAEYLGLDIENLKIIHVSANRGRGFNAMFPRAMGRATPKRRETVNIEVVVKEVV